MSKRKYRRGSHIRSMDELVRQEVVFWKDKPTHKGWFMSWQLGMTAKTIGEKGIIYYAMPAGVTSRFEDEEIIQAERRLRTKPTLNGRTELIRRLNMLDNGSGDINDVIDRMVAAGFCRGGRNG